VLADVGDASPADKNYPRARVNEINISKFALPEKYVVLTTGYTADVKAWPAEEVNLVASWLVANGVTPVFLGKRVSNAQYTSAYDDDVNYSLGLDLREQTSLLEATAIMASAEATCGVDNALLHFAGCTDVPIVAGFTFVSAHLRAPYRDGQVAGGKTIVIEPPESSCKACQNRMHHLYNHLFTTCYIGTKECTTHMTAERFIAALQVLCSF
jgi:ADP-heptose:LPS heptosyltransferase